MQFLQIALTLLLALTSYESTIVFATESVCGDWLSYNDEKCFKILDSTLRSFEDAASACRWLSPGDGPKFPSAPTLPIIISQEEQDFLANYLFDVNKNVENFWIGGKFFPVQKRFKWIDDSELSYTNWDPKGPRNETDYCVEMEADSSTLGKWLDVPCEKKNLVVCQRVQTWSLERLQEAVIEMRKQLLELTKKVDGLKPADEQDVAKKMDEFRKSFEAKERETEKRMADFEAIMAGKVQESAQKIEAIHRELSSSRQESLKTISTLQQLVISSKQECDRKIEDMNRNLTTTLRNGLDEINGKLRNLPAPERTSLVPLGFIYTQLPQQAAPEEIWPEMTWTEVSEAYAGVFFRVVGGHAAPFAVKQEGNAPRVDSVDFVHNHQSYEVNSPVRLPIGGWSGHILTGMTGYMNAEDYNNHHHHDGYNNYFNHILWRLHTAGGEVRPVNMATRVWKRTG